MEEKTTTVTAGRSDFVGRMAAAGCRTEEALDRLFGDEAFYEEMVKELLEDTCFDDLEAAMGRGDAGAAFMAAHTLRGAAMTLGVVPVGGPAMRLTELLRGKDLVSEEAQKAYEELKLGLVKVQFAAFGR